MEEISLVLEDEWRNVSIWQAHAIWLLQAAVESSHGYLTHAHEFLPLLNSAGMRLLLDNEAFEADIYESLSDHEASVSTYLGSRE